MVTMKDMVQVYMFTLHVLATKDDFMSDDREAFNTAVWEAFDGTKKSIFSLLHDSLRNVPKQPVSSEKIPLLWWRNHEPYVP